MALSVNLRGDLAKLSDTELAEQLETAWRGYDHSRKHWRWTAWPSWSHRGPVRHPRVYRFMLGFGAVNSGTLLDWLFLLTLSSKKMEPLLRSNPTTDAHLTLCEIKDIMDEMRRRLAKRKATTT